MIFISWTSYFIFGFLISFLITKLFEKRFLKALMFSFSFSAILSIWFSFPGSSDLSPIFAIAIFETIKSEEANFGRILRPFLTCFLLTFLFSYIFTKNRIKN